MRHYYVEVYTGDAGGAGTDANVHLQLFGRRGDTGKRRLLHSETEGNKFEKGEVKYAAVENGSAFCN